MLRCGDYMKNDDVASQKKQYDSITMLYDIAEDLASTVENKMVRNPDEHFMLIEPLINDVADSADVLAEEYINVLEAPSLKKSAKLKVEKALRKIFMALENYRKRVEELGSETVAILSKTVDPVVEKIVKQTEKIMVIFMHLLEISLDRIMHKQQLEEFRRNNDRLFTNNGLSPQHL